MGKFGMAQMNGQQTVVTLDKALDYWFNQLVVDVKHYIVSKVQRYGLQYATNPLVHTNSAYLVILDMVKIILSGIDLAVTVNYITLPLYE